MEGVLQSNFAPLHDSFSTFWIFGNNAVKLGSDITHH
jgi:hypothetical protein